MEKTLDVLSSTLIIFAHFRFIFSLSRFILLPLSVSCGVRSLGKAEGSVGERRTRGVQCIKNNDYKIKTV